MIVLSSTSQRVRVFLDAAHTSTQLRCVTTWADETATTHSPGTTLSLTNGTTPVEIVPAPAASTKRIVKFISILNADSATKKVTIQVFDGAQNYNMFSSNLAAGERVEMAAGGFRVMDALGAEKTISTPTRSPLVNTWQMLILASDQINANAVANTLQDVTGLAFPVFAGIGYWFKFSIHFTAVVATTGSRWSINGPSFTELRYDTDWSTTVTARTFQAGAIIYDTPASSSTASSALGNTAYIRGFIRPSVDGTVTARFASEVAAQAITAKAGSLVEWIEVA